MAFWAKNGKFYFGTCYYGTLNSINCWKMIDSTSCNESCCKVNSFAKLALGWALFFFFSLSSCRRET